MNESSKLVATESARLDKLLVALMPEHSRSRLSEWIQQGHVKVDGQLRKPSFKVEIGSVIEIEAVPERAAHNLEPASIDLEVLYEDTDMLIVNKPRGLPTHPAPTYSGPTLVNALLARHSPLSGLAGDFRPGIVHRLDKETTGLLVVAKTDQAHARLAKQIERKTAERRYLCVVSAKPERDEWIIDAPIGRHPIHRTKMAVVSSGKPARTHVRYLGAAGSGWLLAVKLETGRTHQIRVHLSWSGLPVLGDPLYGTKNQSELPMQLHAAYLSVTQPSSGERIVCFAKPPADFLGSDSATIDSLEGFSGDQEVLRKPLD